MSQWLHWWLSSLYFVVSHKGTARARPFLSPVLCIEVKIPPTIVTSKTLSKRKINQFGIQKHTCTSIIHVSYSHIFTFLIRFYTILYIYPTSQVTPQVSHQPKANVAMRDPSLHDVVTAAPWTVPKKVLPRAAVGDRPFLWGMCHQIMGETMGKMRKTRL